MSSTYDLTRIEDDKEKKVLLNADTNAKLKKTWKIRIFIEPFQPRMQ